jgi:hypothetical protein
MTPRLAEIVPRLKALLLMLSSDRDGEVVAAARAVGRALKSAGADWHDLVGLLVPGRQTNRAHPRNGNSNEHTDWRAMRAFCLTRMHLLSAREYEFLVDLDRWHGALTEKQHAWLVAIYQRIGGTP